MSLFDQIQYAALSDVGVRRSHNQDDHRVVLAADPDHWQTTGHVFMIADGMGGHAVGEKASAKAVADVPHGYQQHAGDGPPRAIRKAFTEANTAIHAIGQANPEFKGLGTTGTALVLRPEGAWVGHVGDSRCYRVRNGVIEQLSFDHSYVWEMARKQRRQPEEITGIRSNIIIRSLGPDPAVQVDVEGPHPVKSGDVYVLCSDGLSGPVEDEMIGAVVSALPPSEAARFLIGLANLRGGPDNVTVVVVRVADSGEAGGEDRPVDTSFFTRRPLSERLPWPVLSMVAGLVFAVAAVFAFLNSLPAPGAVCFVLAIMAIGAGVYGLVQHAKAERERAADDDPTPTKLNVYRRINCKIDYAFLDKIAKGEEVLCQKAKEKQWPVNWDEYTQFLDRANRLASEGELVGAFAEHCRALDLLTAAFNKNRQKEEAFDPKWGHHTAGN